MLKIALDLRGTALRDSPTPGRSLLRLKASKVQERCVYFPQTRAAQRVVAGGGREEARGRGRGEERGTEIERERER